MKVEDLDVFKLSHKLTLRIYELTGKFPSGEKFGLVSQMRRSATSIPTNIMEGAYRVGRKEFKHFISIAKGSCGETRYQLLLSKDLNYINAEKYFGLQAEYERVSMMLTKLYQSL